MIRVLDPDFVIVLRKLVEFDEGDEAIVIDVNGKVIPFKSLFRKDSYGRCKLSTEGFFKRDDYMEAHVIVEEIILL